MYFFSAPTFIKNIFPSSTLKTTLKNESGIAMLILLVVGLLLLGAGAGGGYILVNNMNKPERIKSTVQPTQTAFENYKNAITDIVEYLEEEDSTESDSESIERSIQ